MVEVSMPKMLHGWCESVKEVDPKLIEHVFGYGDLCVLDNFQCVTTSWSIKLRMIDYWLPTSRNCGICFHDVCVLANEVVCLKRGEAWDNSCWKDWSWRWLKPMKRCNAHSDIHSALSCLMPFIVYVLSPTVLSGSFGEFQHSDLRRYCQRWRQPCDLLLLFQWSLLTRNHQSGPG